MRSLVRVRNSRIFFLEAMSTESLDHRERRLMQLGEAVEALLDEGWSYWLIVGKVGEPDSTNIVSNTSPETALAVVEGMLEVIRERYSKGVKATEL